MLHSPQLVHPPFERLRRRVPVLQEALGQLLALLSTGEDRQSVHEQPQSGLLRPRRVHVCFCPKACAQGRGGHLATPLDVGVRCLAQHAPCPGVVEVGQHQLGHGTLRRCLGAVSRACVEQPYRGIRRRTVCQPPFDLPAHLLGE